MKPRIDADGSGGARRAACVTLGTVSHARRRRVRRRTRRPLLFTENETNAERLFGIANATPYVKDAFHDYVIHGEHARRESRRPSAPKPPGTTCSQCPPAAKSSSACGSSPTTTSDGNAFGDDFDAHLRPAHPRSRRVLRRTNSRPAISLADEERRVARQAYAGLLWSKQFYHYVVEDWLDGDPDQPPPPEPRKHGRNHDWPHLFNRDVISMPDKWEYPWYAAWDLAFHMLPMARVDGEFAKEQLLLFLREWYMHPNGQMPAYEFALRRRQSAGPRLGLLARLQDDRRPRPPRPPVPPPRVSQAADQFHLVGQPQGPAGPQPVRRRLPRPRQHRRVRPLASRCPTAGSSNRPTAPPGWRSTARRCSSMALELAADDPSYEDIASKFFEHFVAIADAMNSLGGMGLWDEQDGFYYDVLNANGTTLPLRIRSMVGIIPLFAVEVLEQDVIDQPAGLQEAAGMVPQAPHRPGPAHHLLRTDGEAESTPTTHTHHAPSPAGRPVARAAGARAQVRPRRKRIPLALRRAGTLAVPPRPSLSGSTCDGMDHRVDYTPGESNTGLFGGNSNWRGPIWFPVNYLLIEALERYHHFYGDYAAGRMPHRLRPTDEPQAGRRTSSPTRLTRLFLPDDDGRRPCHGDDRRYANDPHWRDLVLFYEYFHGDTGRGIGASHQTGWTALVAELLHGA